MSVLRGGGGRGAEFQLEGRGRRTFPAPLPPMTMAVVRDADTTAAAVDALHPTQAANKLRECGPIRCCDSQPYCKGGGGGGGGSFKEENICGFHSWYDEKQQRRLFARYTIPKNISDMNHSFSHKLWYLIKELWHGCLVHYRKCLVRCRKCLVNYRKCLVYYRKCPVYYRNPTNSKHFTHTYTTHICSRRQIKRSYFRLTYVQRCDRLHFPNVPKKSWFEGKKTLLLRNKRSQCF